MVIRNVYDEEFPHIWSMFDKGGKTSPHLKTLFALSHYLVIS